MKKKKKVNKEDVKMRKVTTVKVGDTLVFGEGTAQRTREVTKIDKRTGATKQTNFRLIKVREMERALHYRDTERVRVAAA